MPDKGRELDTGSFLSVKDEVGGALGKTRSTYELGTAYLKCKGSNRHEKCSALHRMSWEEFNM